MTRMVPVVDLFAGPGGLAEGFSACRRPDGRRRYRIALSIEKDPVAHRTLLLRAFLRKFAKGFAPEYYDFLNGVVPEEPDWAKLYRGGGPPLATRPSAWSWARTRRASFFETGSRRSGRKHGGRTVASRRSTVSGLFRDRQIAKRRQCRIQR